VNCHCNRDIGQARGDASVDGAMAVEQFLSNLAPNCHSVEVETAHLNTKQGVERNSLDEVARRGEAGFVVGHGYFRAAIAAL